MKQKDNLTSQCTNYQQKQYQLNTNFVQFNNQKLNPDIIDGKTRNANNSTSKIIQSYEQLLNSLNAKLAQVSTDLQLTKEKLSKTETQYAILLGYMNQHQKINVSKLANEVDLLEKKIIIQNAQIVRLKARILQKYSSKLTDYSYQQDNLLNSKSEIEKRDISKFFNFQQMRQNDSITKRLRRNSVQEQQVSQTWQKALEQHTQSLLSSPTKFKRKTAPILRKFIPHEQRAKVWPVIFENPLGLSQALYIQLSQRRQTIQSQVISQIHRDIVRSFNNKMDVGNKQVIGAQAQQILQIFHLLRPDISYVQGMTYPVIVLTIVVGKIGAWKIWGSLVTGNKFFRNMYSFQQKSIQIYSRVFEMLLKQSNPDVAKHLQNNNIKCELFLVQWFFTIFSRGLSMQTTLKIWDLLGYQKQVILYKICLSIFQIIGKKLLVEQYQETVGLIQSYWAYIDQNKMLQLIINSKLTNQKLDKCFMKAKKDVYGHHLIKNKQKQEYKLV